MVATGLAVAAVLRVLVLRGAFGAVVVDLEAVDLRGINVLACLLIHYKTKTTLFSLPRYIMKQKSPVSQLSQKKNGLRDRSENRAFGRCTLDKYR